MINLVYGIWMSLVDWTSRAFGWRHSYRDDRRDGQVRNVFLPKGFQVTKYIQWLIKRGANISPERVRERERERERGVFPNTRYYFVSVNEILVGGGGCPYQDSDLIPRPSLNFFAPSPFQHKILVYDLGINFTPHQGCVQDRSLFSSSR